VVITSGGEARKLMMARALYKTPPSCCGTNPPAAPDPVPEYEVYRRFSHISGGRTFV
jgi:ATP-binding cassette, subfamily B, bacterial